MICYAFPLAHEAGEFLKRCTQKESFTVDRVRCTLANLGGRQVLVALLGMGQAQAAENTQTLFRYFRPKGFVLAGYAGALVPQMKVGQVALSNNYSSPEVQPFLRLVSGFDFANFCTADEVADTPKKRDWYAKETRQEVIEMESAAVAEIVLPHLIPFMAVRVISDDYHQVLPMGALSAGFDRHKGRVTPLRLLGHLALHPGEIGPFRKFVSGISIARKNLTRFLEQLNKDLPASW